MLNFKKPLSQLQRDRFLAMRGLLGGCLDNIADITQSISTVIGVNMVMGNCKRVVEEAEERVESSLKDCVNFSGPIDTMKRAIDHLGSSSNH